MEKPFLCSWLKYAQSMDVQKKGVLRDSMLQELSLLRGQVSRRDAAKEAARSLGE